MSRERNTPIDEAKAILRGKMATPDESLKLCKALKASEDFSYAWRILARARGQQIPDAQQRLELAQEQALCTYKDPALAMHERLTRALEILEGADDLASTTNQETLGLVGAIYKRKWEVDTQKQTLERSLAYYKRGYEQGPASDQGYTGINAAFVLDLLADQEHRSAAEAGAASESAEARRLEARQIREDLVAQLSPLADESWWFLVTVAEAYFGLEDYEKAQVWLQKARALPNIEDWQFASTARQLALLARLHNGDASTFDNTPAWEVLKEFLGGDVTAVQTVFAGKLGVGLSGGGFRASLFHIGVLARLAELNMLRHVETISCVSGGSIIGAHYYLELRKLLQEKLDGQITHQDYLDLVARVQRDFLEGVQRNVRMRVLASLSANWRMFLSPDYSRTDKVGELYESEIFSRVQDGEGGEDRWINRLHIKPMGEDGQCVEGFRPKHQNWRRRNKVPTLILNATTLNTGHNWQFTVSRMGESPASIDPEVDANERLRRMNYNEAPAPHKNVRLGRAVGASSCVPALFEPVVLKDLYPERTVRLVDGGVHDNQGIVGLLEQDCTVLLVSDASGQMGSEAAPSKSELGVLLRSNSILQARIRGSEFDDLKARRRSSLLRGMLFIHLKQDLDADPVDWVGTEDPFEGSVDARPAARRGPLTSYGIQKDVQRLLAGIRTDLDSFSDAEAFALMTSGYRMTEHSFPRCINGFPTAKGNTDWPFLSVEKAMTQQEGADKLKQLLKVGASIPFKIWMLSKPLKVLSILLGLVMAAASVWVAVKYPTYALVTITVGMVAGLAGTAVATALLGQGAVGMFQFKESMKKRGVGLAMGMLGWIVAGIHLLIFDEMYLRWGKVDNIVDS